MNDMNTPPEEQLGRLLLSRGLTMGTAESCTGGNIAHRITSVPGSSAWFQGGIVSYANPVKRELLGVSSEALEEHGAVSRQVVEQMARGAKRVLHCDCTLATSGIAGPGGGSAHKPVGTVWIAALYGDQLRASLFHFKGNRQEVIAQSSDAALTMLAEMINAG
ncbi:MAG: CinA family protein [Tannerellaceae bacterium]|jgi:PncC family amidohydrolase|nr:CinA family protein [Tannerellaceae bacterium]